MTTIHYERTSGVRRYWNVDWFLHVDIHEATKSHDFYVEITTAVPPGPKTSVGGMMVAKTFVTVMLRDEEARRFATAYEKAIENAQPEHDSSARPSP